jgi:hypothetical protein
MNADEKRREEDKRDRRWNPEQRKQAILSMIAWVEEQDCFRAHPELYRAQFQSALRKLSSGKFVSLRELSEPD